MRRIMELLDIESIVLKLDHRAFIVVGVTIVRCRKNRDHLRKRLILPIQKLESLDLYFVSSDQ